MATGSASNGAAARGDVADRAPAVRLEHLIKTYPGNPVPAVKDVSLDIQEGQVFTLLGPSGCGKTTTLRMIAGLESVDEGKLLFRDRVIVDTARGYSMPPHSRDVGMVFQSYAIWPHMTVEDNVGFPLKVRRAKRAEIQERVARALDLVGLSGLEKRPAPMLSGGQQQRVALARALIYEPDVLLLDEPFSNLDAKLREQMRLEVKLLQRKTGVTIVFVTHDQVEALSLSNRIAVMDLGVVQQIGSPHELYQNPANAFVRDFLGKTVLLTGAVKVSNPSGQVAVEIDGAPGSAVFGRSATAEGLEMGQAVNVAMRPEDVKLAANDGKQDPSTGLPGVIETQQFVGERTEYRVRLEGQPPLLAYSDWRQSFGEGDSVWVGIEPDAVAVWPGWATATRTEDNAD
ncbi:MAG: ABC transporter ATP-binding protein [Chloroflexota bacterium]|nr:ABC transporter ATP-binding protein [Chloroflexota bacterium]MDE2885319.1 ABC transporter ATP-binding protein [Chloroflexota bacterium]